MTTDRVYGPRDTPRKTEPWRWLPLPDLQALVARYGRLDLIPPEAWQKWDDENRAYQEAIRRH